MSVHGMQDAPLSGFKASGEIFEYWVSFTPMAPFFGVRWAFRDLIEIALDEAPYTEPETDAPVEISKEIEAAVETAVEAFDAAVEASVKTVDTPTAKPEPEAPEAASEHTDLTQIKGIGPKLAELLNERGVASVEQIAAMSDAQMQELDDSLPIFKGRAFRDDWVGRARALLD